MCQHQTIFWKKHIFLNVFRDNYSINWNNFMCTVSIQKVGRIRHFVNIMEQLRFDWPFNDNFNMGQWRHPLCTQVLDKDRSLGCHGAVEVVFPFSKSKCTTNLQCRHGTNKIFSVVMFAVHWPKNHRTNTYSNNAFPKTGISNYSCQNEWVSTTRSSAYSMHRVCLKPIFSKHWNTPNVALRAVVQFM